MPERFKTVQMVQGIFFILLLSLSSGFYIGMRNVDDKSPTVVYSGLQGKVEVYRDQYGIPTIIADTLSDLVYAQGYEYARDRLFQLEFYRSILNGELSRLFGPATVEADMFLRTIGLKRAAIQVANRTEPFYRNIASSYVQGINDFIDTHLNNLPLEFQILGVDPKHWTIEDTFGIHGILAYNFAFAGLSNEIGRYELMRKVGVAKSLELLPVEYEPAREYLLSLNKTEDIVEPLPLKLQSLSSGSILGYSVPEPFRTILFPDSRKFASNNWVIAGSKTKSGNPIIANDPHLGLAVPGLWYYVTLIAKDVGLHVQGFSLPGLPLVGLGHNQYIAWGATSGIADSLDTYYLKRNQTHYLINNSEWIPFEQEAHRIPVRGESPVDYTVLLTQYGPMLNVSIEGIETQLALQWTYLEQFERNLPFKAIYLMNIAKNVDEFHEAQRYLIVPGFNWVVADIQGNIALHLNALAPIRTRGYGLIPQNGSDGGAFWNGSIPFEEQYYVKNPSEGFLLSANERVDKRNAFYLSESYALGYRARRISEVLSSNKNFPYSDRKWDLTMVHRLQADVRNLVAEDILDPILDKLLRADFSTVLHPGLTLQAVQILENWDKEMGISSTGGLLFTTFSLFLVNSTFFDELGWEMVRKLQYPGLGAVAKFLSTNSSLSWFDDVSTTEIENSNEIAIMALGKTVDYLSQKFGSDPDHWKWGTAHKIEFEHPMGGILPFLDIGGKGMNGTSFTVNALEGPWFRSNGEIRYDFAYGPSMHFTAEVEPGWESVEINYPPGVSGNPASRSYDNLYEMWRNFNYFSPSFNEQEIREGQRKTVVYRNE
ncbi:MAG: penicillin acylase family protein [Methanobacteriota archaeon]|nr:MAG: penicillin acylase family protein [Euryarchaeota archaeon]